MEKPTISQKEPYKIEVESGKTYYWCACGLSQTQPFCDNSHKKEGRFKPVKYSASSNKIVFFCGCKLTKHRPFCDNTHVKL
ncbi:CDGSH iron-sulfur domain-containing protein [Pelagibacteraceae bacterium]|nr:CDGSH iron-sulfur domain-containing protein [Pelagibacteraceae bacterium]